MMIQTARAAPGARSPALPRVERRQLNLRLQSGAYRLPFDVADRLGLALVGYRNHDAALALAVFLARFWSSRARLASPFPIDRRALADRADLGLTEAEIRGAIRVLEEIGYLNRGLPAPGSVYRLKPEGLHRKPILFGFGGDYGPRFAAANARAARARKREEGKRRALEVAARPLNMRPTNSPKDKSEALNQVLMGEGVKSAGRQSLVSRSAPFAGLDRASRQPGLVVTTSRPASPSAFDSRLDEIMRRAGHAPKVGN